MDRRSFKKKYKTAHRFGSRKRKSPMHRKKKDTSVSTSRSESSFREPQDASVVDAVPSTSGAASAAATAEEIVSMPSTSTGRTIQVHLEPRFVSTESCLEHAAAVQASLGSVSATERKMKLMGEREESAGAEEASDFMIVQVAALNALLSETPCQQCLQPGLTVVPGTRHGLVVKIMLTCKTCGVIAHEWSSPRKEGGRAFDVNLRAMQAIKSIGKGSTALTDFWSIMNVSHRGLHHKTFQAHLNAEFQPAGDEAAANVFSDAVAAVRRVYTEIEPTFTLRAYREACSALGISPSQHALRRAREKDALRKKKASKALEMSGSKAVLKRIQRITTLVASNGRKKL